MFDDSEKRAQILGVVRQSVGYIQPASDIHYIKKLMRL